MPKNRFGGEGTPHINGAGRTGQRNAHPIDLSTIKDQSLEGIERRIRNLSHEELFAFDKDGNLVAGYRGNKNSVAYPEELLRERGYTVTHGHPKGMEEFGGTFSWKDIDNMVHSRWDEHRATASGQGEMNYIMRRTSKSNPNGLVNRINKDIDTVESNVSSEYQKAYTKVINGGGTEAAAIHAGRQAGVGVLNSYYKETLPKYGYEYVTRKQDYKYNR